MNSIYAELTYTTSNYPIGSINSEDVVIRLDKNITSCDDFLKLLIEKDNEINFIRFQSQVICWLDAANTDSLSMFNQPRMIHNDNRPAVVEYNRFGNIKQVRYIYYNYGKKHRTDGPAETVIRNDTEITFLYWLNNQIYYSFDHYIKDNVYLSDEEKTLLILTT